MSASEENANTEKIAFIPKKRRAFRNRKMSDESDDEEDRQAIQLVINEHC